MLTARQLIDLESLGEGRYRARHNLDNGTGAIFGGQLLAVALAAAQREVPGAWPAHSISGHFLRAGQLDAPMEIEVERTGDSRRFAARRALIRQGGRAAFDLLCSFHDSEDGLHYEQGPPAPVRGPEGLMNLAEIARAYPERLPELQRRFYTMDFPIELRLVDPDGALFEHTRSTQREYWMRVPSADATLDAAAQQCLLALVADYFLPSGSSSLHATALTRADAKVVSLNHSQWFHAPARTDGWLLYRTEVVSAASGRAIARGQLFDREQRLVSTTTQEFLFRLTA